MNVLKMMQVNGLLFKVAYFFRVTMLGLCALSMVACNQNVEKPIEDRQPILQNKGISLSNANDGSSFKKITEATERINVPVSGGGHISLLPDYALDFVGRYYTNVKCNDGFAHCDDGTAEYVLTLLADGTAYRSIMQHGKIFTVKDDENERKDIKTAYRKDRWGVNSGRNELVVYRGEGVNIYYDMKNNTHLIMNIEKTKRLNGKQGSLQLPTISYVLKKDIETE